MASDNCVTLVGNITDDPELRFTPSGLPVANFTVAVNRRVPKDGGWEDKLEGFFRCSCWRDMAENVAESLQKGARVMVVGRLQQRSWEDQDGNKRSAVEVQVDEIGPSLRWATARPERSQRSGGGSGGGGSSQPAAQPAAQPASGGDSWGPPASVGGAAPDEGGF
jgi:single-strand DNA-binding protein